ncbi:MAG: amidophosphoribosyltransferase, partial [Clostridia bacterium]|nr:amidophosphoribosyltransferase [Clostridia bacterium]
MENIHEECGVFGYYSTTEKSDIARNIYYGLFALQHRGQEACGIAVNKDRVTSCKKGMGLVSEVFNDKMLAEMTGNIGIGHVRYCDAAFNNIENAQPLFVKYVKGTLAIAHNGNLFNAVALRKELENEGALFHSTGDAEIIAYLIARARLKCPTVEDAVAEIIPRLQGSFSLVIMSPTKLIAVRDPNGVRPLCMGRLDKDYIFSSETCGLDTVGATFERDILPGEIVTIHRGEIKSNKTYCTSKGGACIFEHIYTARPDSVIDGQSVNESRILAGRLLAKQHPVEADIVIGVPDSGLSSAIGYSKESGIPYGTGLIKNRYIGRTFILPTQQQRENAVALKLNALRHSIEGKRVVMVDDSIVRGTTIANIVKMLKKNGAKEVHVRVSSPKFLFACYFGTDVPDGKDLACNKYTDEQLLKKIDADSLGFLDVNSLDQIVPDSTTDFCTGCFTGKY